MRRILIAMVPILLFISLAQAEEPPAPQRTLMDAYNALPDDPTPEQEAEFYRLLLERAVVDLPPPSRLGSADLFRSVGIPEFDDVFFTTAFDERNQKYFARPWKMELLGFLAVRLWFEGKTAVPVTPDQDVSRFTTGCCCLMRVIRGVGDERPPYVKTGARKREMYRRYAAEKGILERHEKIVKECEDKLDFKGDTVRDRIEKWRASLDALGSRDYYLFAAHAAWLWDNVTLKDVLLKVVPETIPVRSTTRLRGIASEYFADWFILQDASLWNELGPKFDGPTSLRLAVLFGFSAISGSIRNEDARSLRASLLCVAVVMNYGEKAWLLPERLSKEILPTAQQASNDQDREQARGGDGGLRLAAQAKYRGGGAWFAGETVLDPGAKEMRVEQEFLYPQIQFRYGNIGLGVLFQCEASPSMYPCLLGMNEFFRWKHYEDGLDDPPHLLKYWPVGLEVACDMSPKGLEASFGNGKSERFFKGLQGVNADAYRTDDFLKDFTPGLFYHFPSTVCYLYTMSAYDPDADYVFYDYPITILIVQPEENAKPDDAMVGLKWKGLDAWLGRCGLEINMKRMWNSVEWAEDKANTAVIKAADDLCKKLESDTKDRWNAGREECEKRRKHFWGE